MELKNQPIYKGVHKTLCINFWAYAAFFPKIMYIRLLDRNDIFFCARCLGDMVMVSL